MGRRSTKRILGIVYFDPSDPRLLPPRRFGLGWTVNFGHPRAVEGLGWIVGAWWVVMLAIPIVAHPTWFAAHPADWLWALATVFVALCLLRLNPCVAVADYRHLALVGFGGLAAAVGFGVQGLINGPLVLWWGQHLTWQHHLVLGPVAAAAQTGGKLFALVLLRRVRPDSNPRGALRQGLFVGLGFTVLENTLLFLRAALARSDLGPLGLWERATSSMFHIYSGGFVALALERRRRWPIVLVVGVHALTDILAGTGGIPGMSIVALEATFSACAVFLWIAFILAARGLLLAPRPPSLPRSTDGRDGDD